MTHDDKDKRITDLEDKLSALILTVDKLRADLTRVDESCAREFAYIADTIPGLQ